jgi:RNA polymerase sigma factor (TIGR02999 family)
LFSLVVPDLRRLAQYLIAGERNRHAMQATELVNQIYVRLVSAKDRDWESRRHFFAIAGRAMRRYLIDRARAQPSGDVTGLEPWEAVLAAETAKLDVALIVDQLMDEMASTHPEWCTLIELKYFLGVTDEEAAEILGLKLRTLQRMWMDARRWLFQRVKPAPATRRAGTHD